MAKSKAKQAKDEAGRTSRTAAEARRTASVQVENPYGNGGCDRVTVVSDTVAWLAARGMIDVRQQAAAERYRRAHETVHGGLSCILGKDVVGGPRGDGVSERRLEAGGVLRDAHALLGPIARVVQAIVGEGRSIEDVALQMHAAAGRGERAAVSLNLRMGLQTLADAWEGPIRAQPIRSSHSEGYRPEIGPVTGSGCRAG